MLFATEDVCADFIHLSFFPERSLPTQGFSHIRRGIHDMRGERPSPRRNERAPPLPAAPPPEGARAARLLGRGAGRGLCDGALTQRREGQRTAIPPSLENTHSYSTVKLSSRALESRLTTHSPQAGAYIYCIALPAPLSYFALITVPALCFDSPARRLSRTEVVRAGSYLVVHSTLMRVLARTGVEPSRRVASDGDGAATSSPPKSAETVPPEPSWMLGWRVPWTVS